VVAGVVLVALAVAAAALWPSFESYTGAAPPTQFSAPVSLDPAVRSGDPHVLGIAHNAGNNLATLAAAKRAGAGVIEVDVISARGRLVAGREQFWPWLARLVFRGPSLEQAWDAAGSSAIKLDLKQDDHAFLVQVADFVAKRAGTRPVMISSPDANALLFLHARLPHATLLFTLADPDAVSELHGDPALIHAVGGVSAFQGLVDTDLVHWAHRHGLTVIAWTVTTGQQLNELLRLDVDGITTPNLAVLNALSTSGS